MNDTSQSLNPYNGFKQYFAWFTLPILITLPLLVFYHCLTTFGTGKGFGIASPFTLGLWFLFEWLFPYRHDWRKRSDKQLFNNIFHMALAVSGRIGLQQWFRIVVFVSISDFLIANEAQFVLTVWPDHWPVVAQILLCVFVAEGVNYWRHRLLHESPLLWPMHTLHHSVDRLHSLKGSNTHIFEAVSGVVVVAVPLIIVGCPGDIFVWYAVANMILPTHVNIHMNLPSFVHYLIVTPALHYLHHSKDHKYGTSNYASVLPVWDIILGTFYHPDENHYRTVGIKGDRMPSDLLGQLMSPINWHRLEEQKA